MAKSCVYKPTIKKGNQEVESRLFNDLLSLTGNRESSKYLWGLSQIKDFTDTLQGIEYDENGEVTIESYDKALNIKDLIGSKTTLLTEKRNIGAINNKNESIKHDSAESIIDKVIQFNKDNLKLVASINRSGTKFTIDVNPKNLNNMEVPNDLMFSNSLNNQLRGLMRNIGFDVEVRDDLTYGGIFDPLSGKETADGLRTIIQIAKGEQGEEAFPEEFSHFMIEGLINEPLVQRILNSLNSEDVLKEVLGDNFDEYNTLYRGDLNMLRKEAAGKLLQNQITKLDKVPVSQSLFSRLWNMIKNIFGKLNSSTIDKAISDANNNIEKLATSIMNGSIIPLFDKSLLQDAKPLYNISKDINKLQELAEKSLKLYSKRLNIIRLRSKNGKYSDEDLESIKKLQKLNEEKKYVQSSLAFLTDSLSEIETLQKDINRLSEEDPRADTELTKISNISMTLRRIKEFADAYTPIIKDMTNMLNLKNMGEIEISDEDAITIENLALRINKILNGINNTYEDLRFNTVFNFFLPYWGEDKIIELGKNKGDLITLEMVLKTALKDIGGADRWIMALGESNDMLLQLIDKVIKSSQNKRDNILEEILFGLRSIHTSLTKAGYNTDFMYEKDEKGKPTGRLLSDIDFVKFNKERTEYINKLKDEGLESYIIQTKVEAWERKRTESVIVDASTGRIELLPSKSMYGVDRISKLSPEQKEYYDKMMEVKARLDSFVPARYTNTFNAVQIRNDIAEGISNNITNPKKSAKLIMENFKDRFIVRSDNDEFGNIALDLESFNDWATTHKIDISTEELRKAADKKYRRYLNDSRKQVMLDFANRKVENLPVYYTTPLEDMSRLSTDFTSSILAYASMAVNYHEMNKIVDVMELARDLARDRDVQQSSGGKQLMESFKVAHKVFTEAYTKKGDATNIVGRIDDHYASVIYGQRKKDHGSIKVFGENVSIAQTADALKSYTGEIGLALNLFSAINNVLMGKMQMFIESIGGEYYNLKDSAIGKKNYYALLPQYLAELNSLKKNGKLGLLIDKFDALEEFYKDLKSKEFYKSPISRILGDANLMFLNTSGEHYLHCRNMLAMLNANKVQNSSGNMVTLYDSYTTVEQKDKKGNSLGSVLLLKDGTKTENEKLLFTKSMYKELDDLQNISEERSLTNSETERLSELLDIKSFTNDYTNNLKMKIGKISQSLNGAFNDDDKGALHRHALGRLVAQFKQWMPAHYMRRFGKSRYDTRLDQFREGYYLTIGKFVWNVIKDIRRANFHLATNYSQLTKHEQANIKRALAELTMFGILSGLVTLMGPEKDRKGVWGGRMAIYQAKRLKLEMSATIPIHPEFLKNLMTIVQSPSASIKSFNNIAGLFQFNAMFNEIESGRYKGWNEYARNALNTIPYVGQIRKIGDITNEDYMFNIYN